MVPGHDQYEKRAYLEEQFAIADTNGDGVVDFAEFVAFYTMARHRGSHPAPRSPPPSPPSPSCPR